MTYSCQDESKLAKVQCSQCGGFSLINETIERYDENSPVNGWDGKPTASLKTFCQEKCM